MGVVEEVESSIYAISIICVVPVVEFRIKLPVGVVILFPLIVTLLIYAPFRVVIPDTYKF